MHNTVALINKLESDLCDLRCVDVPTGGDDYEVEWQVIEHHMTEPKERIAGRGKTARGAMIDAFGKL